MRDDEFIEEFKRIRSYMMKSGPDVHMYNDVGGHIASFHSGEDLGPVPFEKKEVLADGTVLISGYDPEEGYYESLEHIKISNQTLRSAEAARQAAEYLRVNQAYQTVLKRQQEEQRAAKEKEVAEFIADLEEQEDAERERNLKIALGAHFITMGVVIQIMTWLGGF